jgi:hypothetical protein
VIPWTITEYTCITMCADINECAEDTHNCEGVAMCVNEVGTFRCSCPTGYVLSQSGTTCNGKLIICLCQI